MRNCSRELSCIMCKNDCLVSKYNVIILHALQMRLEISKYDNYSIVSTTTFSIDRNISYFIKSII